MIQLYNADCLQKLKDLSSNSVDCIICDLPFGCLIGGGTLENPRGSSYVQNACAWDIKIDLEAFWTQIKRIRKNDHTPCLHFCTTKYGFDLYNSNPKEFRYDLVWDKGRGVSFLSANKMPMRSHEMVYVFSKAGAYYNRVDISGNYSNSNKGNRPVDSARVYGSFKNTPKPSNEGKRCVLSVIEHRTVLKKENHPTEKPVELYKFLLSRYCPAGGTVLDPTFGSGNSGVACQELGLNYIGIEKDKDFFEKAKKKLLPDTNNLGLEKNDTP